MAQENQIQIFRYNGSPITFNNGDSVMVNATEMAKPFGKTTKDWLRTKSAEEFITSLSAVRQICPTELVKIVQGGNGEQGTWMHEDVALEFARWLHPGFAIWCNDRIKELLKHGITATEATIESIINDPANTIKILQALQDERAEKAKLQDVNKEQQLTITQQDETIAQQSEVIKEQAIKVEKFDTIYGGVAGYRVSQLAAMFGISSAKALNKILKDLKIQHRVNEQWILNADYQGKGYTAVVTTSHECSDGRKENSALTVWTEPDRVFLHGKLSKAGYIKNINL